MFKLCKDLEILEVLKQNLFGTIFYDKTYFIGGFLRVWMSKTIIKENINHEN